MPRRSRRHSFRVLAPPLAKGRLDASHSELLAALMSCMDQSPANALRSSERDPEAFVAFYEHHAKSVLAYSARRVYDPDVALDLTAETFAQAYLSRGRFRGHTDAEAAGWLFRIASRQVARYFRKCAVERRAVTRLGIETVALSDTERDELSELAGLNEARSELRLELQQLSVAQRAALELRVVEELPYREVARRLDISEQAARARVMRGLKALAAALSQGTLTEETSI